MFNSFINSMDQRVSDLFGMATSLLSFKQRRLNKRELAWKRQEHLLEADKEAAEIMADVLAAKSITVKDVQGTSRRTIWSEDMFDTSINTMEQSISRVAESALAFSQELHLGVSSDLLDRKNYRKAVQLINQRRASLQRLENLEYARANFAAIQENLR